MSDANRNRPTAGTPEARTTGTPGSATAHSGAVNVEEDATVSRMPSSMRDRIRWGPVVAGLVVTVATYVLLQLALVATGAYEAAIGEVDGVNEGALLSGVIGLLAFFLGGLVAGATALWKDAVNGALHGIVMWSLALVTLLFMAILGGGFAAGAFGEVTDQFDVDVATEDFDAEQAGEDAQEASAIALLSLALALAAAVGGGVAGAKMWPTTRSDVEVDLRDEDRYRADLSRDREMAGRR
jgi:hypothetical protein